MAFYSEIPIAEVCRMIPIRAKGEKDDCNLLSSAGKLCIMGRRAETRNDKRGIQLKNTYFTGYFPLIAIIMFSLSFSIYTVGKIMELLGEIGLYAGLLEFFSPAEIKLMLLFLLFLLFFMLFAALKLLSDTFLDISLLFFSDDREGSVHKMAKFCSVIYFIGGGISLLCAMSFALISLIFFVTTMFAFMYFLYKASPYFTSAGLVGFVFFHVLLWGCILTAVGYAVIKLYNSLLASLPV